MNIFENISKNYFFIGINLIMIGGQILIIFVGGEAFKIERLNGKDWGLSVGIGALSLPLGALIRLIPDAWIGACLPWFVRKKWAPETISEKRLEEHRDFVDGKEAPLRTLTGLRGNRAQTHIPFRHKMHNAKVKAKEKAHIAGPHDQYIKPLK